MKLPIIQSLWIGAPLSNIEKLCIRSFLDHGHEFHLYTYADIGGIPSGAIVKDANEILPESEIFTYKGGSYAGFANWFRYALLAKHGNFWVDMDTVCIRPFDFVDEIIIIPSTTPIGMPKNHPLMRDAEKFCRELPNKQGIKFGKAGGPAIFTNLVKQHGMLHLVKPNYYFHTLQHWYDAFDKTYADCPTLFAKTYSIHLQNDKFRRYGLNKNARYDSQSLFEQLKAKHGINNTTDAELVTHEFIQTIPIQAAKKHQKRVKRERYLLSITSFLLGLIVGAIF